MKHYSQIACLLMLCVMHSTAYASSATFHQKEAEKAQSDIFAIEKTLDSFHQAAAVADGKTYFNLLTSDAVFLGTDATERWTKTQFKAFALPYFNQGRGWLYTPTQRYISLNKSSTVAFFDELLDNKNYGVCRGSGVLWLTNEGWKIAQYNLSIPMPNALADDLVKKIQTYTRENK